MSLTKFKKCLLFGMAFANPVLPAVFGEFHLEKAAVDGAGKEVMFLLDRNTGYSYWCDSFVDDSDPKNPKIVRAWRKVEKDYNSEKEGYDAKKAKSLKGSKVEAEEK